MRGRGRRPLRCRRSAARARGPRGRAWAPRASGVSRAGTREGRARTRRNRVPPRESAREGRGPDGWQGGGSGSGSRAARSGERAAPGAQDAGRPAATTPARSHCAAALAPPCCGASRGNGVSRSFPRARRGSGAAARLRPCAMSGKGRRRAAAPPPDRAAASRPVTGAPRGEAPRDVGRDGVRSRGPCGGGGACRPPAVPSPRASPTRATAALSRVSRRDAPNASPRTASPRNLRARPGSWSVELRARSCLNSPGIPLPLS